MARRSNNTGSAPPSGSVRIQWRGGRTPSGPPWVGASGAGCDVLAVQRPGQSSGSHPTDAGVATQTLGVTAATADMLPWAASRLRAMTRLMPGTTEDIAQPARTVTQSSARAVGAAVDPARRARSASWMIHAALSSTSRPCSPASCPRPVAHCPHPSVLGDPAQLTLDHGHRLRERRRQSHLLGRSCVPRGSRRPGRSSPWARPPARDPTMESPTGRSVKLIGDQPAFRSRPLLVGRGGHQPTQESPRWLAAHADGVLELTVVGGRPG